jgi:DNA repair exonuclease SbcCD ATPase subunit/DNA repair exonuclease SbcCD nuclease subunit
MISKIAQISDIHLRKSPSRNEEYSQVFDNLITSLKNDKPDRIVLTGDIFHDYLDLQGEQILLCRSLLISLSEICKVVIIRGNHDFRKMNNNRVDSIEALVTLLDNNNIRYYNSSGFYEDDNIIWVVWHHGQKNNNPWKTKEGNNHIENRLKDKVYVDLFHDLINGSTNFNGLEVNNKSLYSIKEFIGDYSMFGDNHKAQFLDKNKRKAYSGSLIAQDFSEGDDEFHGYYLWDVKDNNVNEVSVYNDYSFKNIKITPFIDFDDLDFEIENPTTNMKIRFIWCTLPELRNKINEEKLANYLRNNFAENNIKIFHKNDFIESNKMVVDENVSVQNILDTNVQHKIFREHLEKIGVESKIIEDIIKLDNEIEAIIEHDEISNIEWDIVRMGGVNFMSYEKFDMDWRDVTGLVQINGENARGKTTLLKNLSYVLFGKTLETENRVKYGDLRYVNNRNVAKFCESYLIIEANGEYYGIKRRTDIQRDKNGNINGAPTTLKYYLLNSPDDELNDDNFIDNLSEDRRVKTQDRINTIIGTYDNYMRIVMTTSDTLNRILSNEMSVFIDSLLHDSGLNVFDKKNDAIKDYSKKLNEKNRINCDVNKSLNEINEIGENNKKLNESIVENENNKLPDIKNRLTVGKNFLEDTIKKLHPINPDIINFDLEGANNMIIQYNKDIKVLDEQKGVLSDSITKLIETYDEERLNKLTNDREEHRVEINNLKLKIKDIQRSQDNERHKIEVLNGDNFRLKKDIETKNGKIFTYQHSKTCPTCNRLLEENDMIHIDTLINEIKNEITVIEDTINKNINVEIPKITLDIDKLKSEVIDVEKEIEKITLKMDDKLNEIGILTNQRNDVEKRKELVNKLNEIPTKKQNYELKIELLENKINLYNNSLLMIEENKKTEKLIDLAKQKIVLLENEEKEINQTIVNLKNEVENNKTKITQINKLIEDFREQEYRDNVISLYKKCVHRDGIPSYVLGSFIIPKINNIMSNILASTDFSVWIDVDDFRPKFKYYVRPDSIIDCIGASGKERTFSSLAIKFALNEMNVKSKPKLLLLDEITGKLVNESVDEFIQFLNILKHRMKRVVIIEHNHELNPDHVINVTLNDNGISELTVN